MTLSNPVNIYSFCFWESVQLLPSKLNWYLLALSVLILTFKLSSVVSITSNVPFFFISFFNSLESSFNSISSFELLCSYFSFTPLAWFITPFFPVNIAILTTDNISKITIVLMLFYDKVFSTLFLHFLYYHFLRHSYLVH